MVIEETSLEETLGVENEDDVDVCVDVEEDVATAKGMDAIGKNIDVIGKDMGGIGEGKGVMIGVLGPMSVSISEELEYAGKINSSVTDSLISRR